LVKVLLKNWQVRCLVRSHSSRFELQVVSLPLPLPREDREDREGEGLEVEGDGDVVGLEVDEEGDAAGVGDVVGDGRRCFGGLWGRGVSRMESQL